MISAHMENERTVTGMAEYIERKAAIEVIMSEPPDSHYPQWYADKIKAIPAANVAPVRQGQWVSVPHKLARVCLVCNRDEPYKFADIDADVYDYCQNCGAKMDLRRDGDGT